MRARESRARCACAQAITEIEIGENTTLRDLMAALGTVNANAAEQQDKEGTAKTGGDSKVAAKEESDKTGEPAPPPPPESAKMRGVEC